MTDTNINNGLVRRFIQLRSGRRAWRYVKPNNPNIVQPQPDAPDQPMPPKEKVAVTIPVRSTKIVHLCIDYLGCCGATFLDPEERFVDETDMEAKRRRWEGYYKIYNHDHYLKMAAKASNEYYKQHYKHIAEQYSFENMVRGLTLGREVYQELTDSYKSYGIIVSPTPFKDSVETPAGLFIRNDYPAFGPDAQYDLSHALIEVKEPTPDDRLSRQRVGIKVENFFGHRQHGSVHVISGMERADLANELSTFIANKKEIEPGHVVTFILNRTQQTQRKANTLAAAGFRCTLVTGNRNHPNASILYLYERTVTEADKKL